MFKLIYRRYGKGIRWKDDLLSGLTVALALVPEAVERQRGLVWGTIGDAIKRYKGSAGSEHAVVEATAMVVRADEEPAPVGEAQLAGVTISRKLADDLGAGCGDLVYVSDTRKWLGGLRSSHAVVVDIREGGNAEVVLGADTFETVVVPKRAGKAVMVRRRMINRAGRYR